ncbi:MAG TPA: NAD(P)H-binding protein [Thermoplasmata archaeon]|nr:NAD(P)H-binding protein [Thermoplasmata archaeon]
MSSGGPDRVLLLVGGGGGLVGRALIEELGKDHSIRSVHRSPSKFEHAQGIEFVPVDLEAPVEWPALLEGVETIVNVAWYRSARPDRFRALGQGLLALIEAAERQSSIRRFVHLSVPAAPEALERRLPYLVWKRAVDARLEGSKVPYAILRPSALFARGDVLLGVLLRTAHRYGVLPMFGEGTAHLSPLSTADLARIVRLRLEGGASSTSDLGGPERFTYRELAELIFRVLGRRPRYWRLSPPGARRLARFLEAVGSTLLYEYEVEWLLSDRLGLPPAELPGRALESVEPYLAIEALRWRTGHPTPSSPENHG